MGGKCGEGTGWGSIKGEVIGRKTIGRRTDGEGKGKEGKFATLLDIIYTLLFILEMLTQKKVLQGEMIQGVH